MELTEAKQQAKTTWAVGDYDAWSTTSGAPAATWSSGSE